MARRTGIFTINQVAKRLCRLTAQFTPVIQTLFPNNAALLAALAAANASCQVLISETEKELVFGD